MARRLLVDDPASSAATWDLSQFRVRHLGRNAARDAEAISGTRDTSTGDLAMRRRAERVGGCGRISESREIARPARRTCRWWRPRPGSDLAGHPSMRRPCFALRTGCAGLRSGSGFKPGGRAWAGLAGGGRPGTAPGRNAAAGGDSRRGHWALGGTPHPGSVMHGRRLRPSSRTGSAQAASRPESCWPAWTAARFIGAIGASADAHG